MFLSKEDELLGEEFIQRGYVIRPVSDLDALKKIEETVSGAIESFTQKPHENMLNWLNNTHKHISIQELNTFRIHVINYINNDKSFKRNYYNLVRPYLEAIVGNELAMQRRVNLSIQVPGDSSSLLPVHADTWSGDSAFEAVVWIPLVDCFGTKAMYLLPPSEAPFIDKNFNRFKGKSSEDIFLSIEDKVEWIEIKNGQVLIFNQTLPHGNRINSEQETRWSLNCRFKGIFTPYADKKIGEFFEPITLRPMSNLGMNYKLPDIQ